jgi:hypothetical protein
MEAHMTYEGRKPTLTISAKGMSRTAKRNYIKFVRKAIERMPETEWPKRRGTQPLEIYYVVEAL